VPCHPFDAARTRDCLSVVTAVNTRKLQATINEAKSFIYHIYITSVKPILLPYDSTNSKQEKNN